ncbi:MAG: outer membrane protein assembly factor BamE [Rhodocyclaceae bacterium]|nr:outer membrane protein assembly factor BamE [Rhodocyclaceae bacterium]
MSSRLMPLCIFLAACSSTPEVSGWLSPYRIDVNQGNFVTQEMVARLRPGMTREEVRFVLGTPLIADIFHADRWDYVYRFQPGKGEAQQRRLIVYFEGGRLVRVGGDVVAAESGLQAMGEKPATRVIELGEKQAQ